MCQHLYERYSCGCVGQWLHTTVCSTTGCASVVAEYSELDDICQWNCSTLQLARREVAATAGR